MMTKPLMFSLSIIMILLSMAFFTLLERKILGYSQLRKGPNKVSVSGLPQPLSDALKLFSKETHNPRNANTVILYSCPTLMMLIAMTLWSLMPSPHPFIHLNSAMLLFLCISSVAVYPTLMAGWSSNSKYSLLGAIRSIAQTISYEISMSLFMISFLIMTLTFSTQHMLHYLFFNPFMLTPLLILMWLTTLIAETNRTPFDFAEGESELVSGFNTEYSGKMFAFIFMSEYMNILFTSMLTALMTTQSPMLLSGPLLTLKTMIIASTFLLTRATLPRFRYDRLMMLTWTSFLPISLVIMMMLLLSM